MSRYTIDRKEEDNVPWLIQWKDAVGGEKFWIHPLNDEESIINAVFLLIGEIEDLDKSVEAERLFPRDEDMVGR